MELEAVHYEKARSALLARLKKFSERSGEKVLCVFDAMGSAHSERVEEPHGTVKFLYTKAFETADEAIIELAREKKEGAIVVTSDREIIAAAEKAGSSVVKSPEFDALLRRTSLAPRDREEEEEGFDPKKGTKKKGPSHRRPKKERKVYGKIKGW